MQTLPWPNITIVGLPTLTLHMNSHTISLYLSVPLSVLHPHTSFIFIHNYELTPIHDFLHTNLNQILKYLYPLFDSTKFHLRNS